MLLPTDGSHLGQIGNEQSTGDGLSLLRAYYRRFSLVWLDTDPVVDGAAQLLLTPEITLCCLDRDMTEQKLDLIQFAAC
jgi:hypothetical protein